MNYAETLAIGDRIGMARYGNYGLAEHAFGKVTKITKTGQITVDTGNTLPRRFDKHGNEIGRKYNGFNLIAATGLQEQIDRRKAQMETNRRAKELLDEIQRHKTGLGDYSFDDAARGTLLALVAQL